jgi:AcrR family transcriptional regulator
MDAAEALFLEKGFASASVDEIVKAADVAKGTFYLHFKSKDEVLTALQTRFIETFCDKVQEAMDSRPPEDWHGRLDAWIEATIKGYVDRVALHDIVFHENRAVHRHMRHDNPVIGQLSALLEQGTASRAWSVDEPALTAVMFFHALHGAIDDVIGDATDGGGKIDMKALTALAKPFCRRALGLKP